MNKLLLSLTIVTAAFDTQGIDIHQLVINGDAAAVEHAIKDRANIHATTKNGFTPLHLAARNGHFEIAQILIDAGASVNAQDERRHTPLHLATVTDQTEIVKLLINSGAQSEATNFYGNTPLHEAGLEERVEIAQLLINAGANLNCKNSQGDTPLHNAVYMSNAENIKFLLEKGASPDVKNNKGLTPLDVAKKNNHTDIIALLTFANQAVASAETPLSSKPNPSSQGDGSATPSTSPKNSASGSLPNPGLMGTQPRGPSWFTTKKALFGGMALITAALTYYWYHTSPIELTSYELNQLLIALLATGNQEDAELAYKLIDNHPTAWNNLSDTERVAIQKLLYAYFR